ncbi:MAG TPA: hypothetical protein VGI23_18605, partial [Steroidobacteraceae bacterium]
NSVIGKAQAGLQFLLSRRGPLSISVNQAGGFLKTDDAQAHPNLQLYFNPLSYGIPKDGSNSLRPEAYSGFLGLFAVSAHEPRERGDRLESGGRRAAHPPQFPHDPEGHR